MNDLMKELELLLKDIKQLHVKVDLAVKGGVR
jgi:hypothetical protein